MQTNLKVKEYVFAYFKIQSLRKESPLRLKIRVTGANKMSRIEICANYYHENPNRTNSHMVFQFICPYELVIHTDKNYSGGDFKNQFYYFSIFSTETISATLFPTFGDGQEEKEDEEDDEFA